jgi:hypothetical protein
MKIQDAYERLKQLANGKRCCLEIHLISRPRETNHDNIDYSMFIHELPMSSNCVLGQGNTPEEALVKIAAELEKLKAHESVENLADRFEELDTLLPASPPPAGVVPDPPKEDNDDVPF